MVVVCYGCSFMVICANTQNRAYPPPMGALSRDCGNSEQSQLVKLEQMLLGVINFLNHRHIKKNTFLYDHTHPSFMMKKGKRFHHL